jgi:hypothetical protein|tara:strand:+ start:1006 stop:1458 length:453 start_codon:yes stop_codon:yes gene_type:complete
MFFKKNKFIKEVYKEINLFIEMAKIPRTTGTLKKIIAESEKNSGEPWDSSMDWHLFLSEMIQPLAYEMRSYLYENLKTFPKGAAVYVISSYISDLADHGSIEEMRKSEPDAYDSMEKLWDLCEFLGTEPKFEENYSHLIIVPRHGNPFNE